MHEVVTFSFLFSNRDLSKVVHGGQSVNSKPLSMANETRVGGGKIICIFLYILSKQLGSSWLMNNP